MSSSSQPDRNDWTIRQSQALVDEWIRSVGVRYFNELTNLAQLVEEVGEVARILSRSHGEQSSKPGERLGELSDELADILFVVICLANQSGIDLQTSLERNLTKKSQRDVRRHRENPKLSGKDG
jgi:NTP pyrophosphatase (non-canonical NTP hydrolase)